MIRTYAAEEEGGSMGETCAWCGAELDVSWVDTSMLGMGFTTTRGRVACPTRGSVPRCPICLGEVGDIHGPHCGPVMAAKLGDLEPGRITRADCGERRAPRERRAAA